MQLTCKGMVFLLMAGVACAVPVQVGTLPAKIVPEQVASLPMERGVVSDLATAERLEQGAIIAVLNKEQMAQEEEEMELKLARERISHKDDIRKLEIQRHKIKFYLSLSRAERQYAQSSQPDEPPPTQQSLADIDERMALLNQELQSLERVKRNELLRKHAKNTLKMPFAGRIQYHFTQPEVPGASFEYHPAGSLPFATVCDDSAFYITLNMSRAELTQLPENSFRVEVKLPEGHVLHGKFARRRVEYSGNNDSLVYYFCVPKEDHDRVFDMLGSNVKATLIYEAPEDAQMVSKVELAHTREAAQCSNWEELVQILYPEYDLVFIAERDIIIRPKKM